MTCEKAYLQFKLYSFISLRLLNITFNLKIFHQLTEFKSLLHVLHKISLSIIHFSAFQLRSEKGIKSNMYLIKIILLEYKYDYVISGTSENERWRIKKVRKEKMIGKEG